METIDVFAESAKVWREHGEAGHFKNLHFQERIKHDVFSKVLVRRVAVEGKECCAVELGSGPPQGRDETRNWSMSSRQGRQYTGGRTVHTYTCTWCVVHHAVEPVARCVCVCVYNTSRVSEEGGARPPRAGLSVCPGQKSAPSVTQLLHNKETSNPLLTALLPDMPSKLAPQKQSILTTPAGNPALWKHEDTRIHFLD